MPADQSDALPINQALPEPLPPEPFGLFMSWFDEARARRVQPNPNAMALATVDASGAPSVRMVLCKAINAESGFVVFYTNYLSRKGRALAANPRAAAVFHWDTLDRQVRIEGPVSRSPTVESDAYFATRPVLSRIGAWASAQSEPVANRGAMLERLRAAEARFGVDAANPLEPPPGVIPRPAHWGGARLWAERVELWVGGVGRLHDRASWVRELMGPEGAEGVFVQTELGWQSSRLQP